jgi:uncharacterized coiled-coil DUF342 family protein
MRRADRAAQELRAVLDERLGEIVVRLDELVARMDALNEKVHDVNVRLDRTDANRAEVLAAVEGMRAELGELGDAFVEAAAFTGRELRDRAG